MDKLCQDEMDKNWNKMKEQWDKDEVSFDYIIFNLKCKLTHFRTLK